MTQEPHLNPDGRWGCSADDCTLDAIQGWTRWDDEGNQIMVYACDDHQIGIELAARIHDPTCLAPPTCDCSVAQEVGG